MLHDRFGWKGDYIMKSTGIVRRIDELGRIVLPIELRRTYDLAIKDASCIIMEATPVRCISFSTAKR